MEKGKVKGNHFPKNKYLTITPFSYLRDRAFCQVLLKDTLAGKEGLLQGKPATLSLTGLTHLRDSGFKLMSCGPATAPRTHRRRSSPRS